MVWAKPEFSKERVKKAGALLAQHHDLESSSPELEEALQILSNWRSSHNYPLNTFQANLRAKLSRLGLEEVTVAQRLKRISSIINKLQLNPNMSLSRMQDIGGLRAVVSTVSEVEKLRTAFKSSRFEHQLVLERDYIAEPKASGYRGIHLIYKYSNRKGAGPSYKGLQVEIQIRNKAQHSWATAVETAGLFLGQALKSSVGSDKWLEFFSFVSSAFAILEKSPFYEGHRNLTKSEIFDRVVELERELQVISALEVYKAAVNYQGAKGKDYHYFIMCLDPATRSGRVMGFKRDQFDYATQIYLGQERAAASSSAHVVLVAARSIEALKKAYPNYFMDTSLFVARLKRVQAYHKDGEPNYL